MKIERAEAKCRTCKTKFPNLGVAHEHKLMFSEHKIIIGVKTTKKDILYISIFFICELIVMLLVIEYIVFPIFIEDKPYIIDCSIFRHGFEQPCIYTPEYNQALGHDINA